MEFTFTINIFVCKCFPSCIRNCFPIKHLGLPVSFNFVTNCPLKFSNRGKFIQVVELIAHSFCDKYNFVSLFFRIAQFIGQ